MTIDEAIMDINKNGYSTADECQLIWWLEELKAYRENDNGYSKEYIELNCKAMYNKAIDDLTNMILTEIKYGVGGNIEDFIKEIAEQLKEGGTSETDNK